MLHSRLENIEAKQNTLVHYAMCFEGNCRVVVGDRGGWGGG